jgi:ketosteroid isomerase-like protein
MSQENVEVVQGVYGAMARGEFPTELFHAEVEYVNPEGAVEPGTRHGLDGFHQAMEKVAEGWASWEMESDAYEAAGDRVAVTVRYRARGRSSGLEIEGRESALWTLSAGKVVRYEWFQEEAGALEALRGRPAG